MLHRIALLTVLLLVASSALAETLILPVTADTGVSSFRGKERFSNGGASETALRQNQNWSGFENMNMLMAFAEKDASGKAARGMTVTKANLHVVVAKKNLYGLGLCTMLSPWAEGTAADWTEQAGSSSWAFARTPKAGEAPTAESWYAWPGSGVYSVCWMHPSARYSHAGPDQLKRAKTAEGGFEELVIPVDPAVAAAVLQGFSYGLMVTDDKGQVTESLSLVGPGVPYKNNDAEDPFVFTCQAKEPKYRPYLEVEGDFTDKTPPAAPGAMKVARTSPSEQTIWVAFAAPADDKGAVLGYEAAVSDQPIADANFDKAKKLPLWSMPKPAAAGAEQQMPIWTLAPGKYNLAVRAVDMAGNRGPVAQLAIEVPAVPEAKLAALPAKAEGAKAQAKEAPASALSVDVVPGNIQLDPLTGAVQLDQEAYSPGEKYRQDNRVWRERQVTLCSAGNEVVAFQLVLGGAGNVKNIRVAAGELAGANGAKIAATNLDFYRLWYVHAGNAVPVPVGPGEMETDRRRNLPPMWHGDACLPLTKPLEETFDFPPADNKIEGQKFQSVWVDLYVPRGTAAGEYAGKITIAADGLKITVPVKLSVVNLQIPDKVTWPLELNRYSSLVGWAGGNNAKDPEGGKAIEQAYYTLGHQHRCTLNVLAYTASGRNDAEYLPEVVDKATANAKASDWAKWDDRFGPMLTGTLFSAARGYKGPGQDTPVTHMYLPFYEYWPMPVDAANYKDYMETPDRLTFADYAKKAGDIDKAISDNFKKGYVGMAKQFFEHFKQKGYTQTIFQFFFNDKYYRRCGFFDAEGMVGSKGVSFWLLDEPVDYDDYAANAFFFRLGRQGYEQANAPEVKVEYRADVSQPEMTRTLWDNVCDLWNDAALGRVYSTADVRKKFFPDERSWQYGGGPGVQGPYVTLARSCLNVWSMGTSGGMPYWNAFGEANAWKIADNLSLYYTGKNYANSGKDYPGPIAGTRMKLMRDSQQMIELLNLLAAKPGWDRPKVRAAIAEFAADPKAVRLTFDKLTLDRLQEMRDRVVQTIAESK